MAIDLDALREGLAGAFWNARYGQLADAAWEAAVRSATAIPGGQAAEAMRATYRRANDFLSNPTVADLIAKAGRVDAAEAERDEARSHLPEGLKDASLACAVQALAFSANAANDSKWRWGHALTIGLAFADKAAGEEWEHGGMASVEACYAMAAILGCECGGDIWTEMAKAGVARLGEHKAALAATQPATTEALASADVSTQEGQSHGQ